MLGLGIAMDFMDCNRLCRNKSELCEENVPIKVRSLAAILKHEIFNSFKDGGSSSCFFIQMRNENEIFLVV